MASQWPAHLNRECPRIPTSKLQGGPAGLLGGWFSRYAAWPGRPACAHTWADAPRETGRFPLVPRASAASLTEMILQQNLGRSTLSHRAASH